MSNNKAELKDEELEKINGGMSVKDENGNVCELIVGDVVKVKNYPMTGDFCLLQIKGGYYKFLEYTTEPYPDRGISLSSFPKEASVTKIGHDDNYVAKNLVGGIVF